MRSRFRRQALRVAETRPCSRPESDSTEISTTLSGFSGPGTVDHALDRQPGVAGELDRPGVGEFAAQFLVGLLDRHRCIEAVVVDLVGIEGVKELPVPVAPAAATGRC